MSISVWNETRCCLERVVVLAYGSFAIRYEYAFHGLRLNCSMWRTHLAMCCLEAISVLFQSAPPLIAPMPSTEIFRASSIESPTPKTPTTLDFQAQVALFRNSMAAGYTRILSPYLLAKA